MYSAPSVSYPVERSRFLGCALAVVWLAGAALAALWCLRAPLVGWHVGIASVTGLLSCLMASRFWLCMPDGELHWDGHGWQGPGASTPPAGLRVRLDMQRHLLVRMHGTSATGQWLWLSAASRPARWHDLRRAIYSHAMIDASRNAAKP